MRILYFDIDSLRPDHLSCNGYARPTSPNIDAIAARGVRYDQCYVSDAPCLPSRSSLFSGQFGIRHGAVAHAGERTRPYIDPGRHTLHAICDDDSWMGLLRRAGYTTTTVSSFPSRHSAWHWLAGFSESYDTGRRGHETVDDVEPTVLNWLRRRGTEQNWFLHVNLWDVHVPYRTPAGYGEPFKDQPMPTWYTQAVLERHRSLPGLRSAKHVLNFGHHYPRYPTAIESLADFRQLIDGYDTAIRYVDDHIGRVMSLLKEIGIAEDTAIVISADHGESLGELNAYGAHLFADPCTTRVPLIVAWPGEAAGAMDGLCYPQDVVASLCRLAGTPPPSNWDGEARYATEGRPYVVTSQLAQSLQRGVRFDAEGTSYFAMFTEDDSFHAFPRSMLFDLTNDPHLQQDLSGGRPDLIRVAETTLAQWRSDVLTRSPHPDPLDAIAAERRETRRQHPHLKALRRAGQTDWADHFVDRPEGFER